MSKLPNVLAARFITSLFLVQFFAMGFCSMLPQANAMPAISDMTMQTKHCADMVEANPQHDNKRSSCNHCDQPDELWQQAHKLSLDIDQVMFTSTLLASVQLIPNSSLTLKSFLPTGPPRSTSLLYTTTQRIRL